MKICMITTMTPTSENIRGTSALPYHLMVERDKNIDIEVYTFNNNNISDEKIAEVEKELRVKIKKVPLPKWFLCVFRLHLLFIRLFLKYPIHHYVKLPMRYVDKIKAKNPDLIWIYGAEWSLVVNQFEGFKRIHTLPDSEALYYYRMLGQRFVTWNWKTFWRSAFMYPKFLALERDYSTDSSIHYHLVGEEDANFLKRMNPGIQAHFIRHPHYEVNEKGNKKFHQPKIKLLIAGQYNYYMKQEADLLSELLRENSEVLAPHYVISFLGKGWEKHVESLRESGYDVEHIKFAPDYIKEICKHDIQITPIAIGTGTKGKVLDALANGLLVIGTPYAMENIAVWHERDISHSSTERIVLPDATMGLFYILKRMQGLLSGLNVYPENMKKNLNKTQDVICSGTLLLTLVDKGLTREQGYAIMQRLAFSAREKNVSLEEVALKDEEIRKYMNEKEIRRDCDLSPHFKNVDFIFKRVFKK